MDKIYIEPTASTPEVIIDPESGKVKITGNSYPSNSTEFYAPILEWFENTLNEEAIEQLEVWFFFNYVNTSSTKHVIKILEYLEPYYLAGFGCQVYWQYDDGDDNMQGIGDDLKNYVNIPFELVKVD